MDLSGLSTITTPAALASWLQANLVSPVRPTITGPDLGVIMQKAISVLNPDPVVLDFNKGVSNPINVTGYQAAYAGKFGNQPDIIIQVKSGHVFTNTGWEAARTMDTATDLLLQSFSVSDPDPDDAAVTADAIRIIIK